MRVLKRLSKTVFSSHLKYGYYTSRAEYYLSLIPEKSIQQLSSVMNPLIPARPSAAAIQFQFIPLESNMHQTRLQLGRPKFIWKNSNFKSHQVLVYKLKIFHIPCFTILHFLDDSLYLVTVTFKKLSERHADKVQSVLGSKYLPEGTVYLPDHLRDEANNRLFIDCNHYFSIKYLSGNLKFQRILEQAQKNRVQQKKRYESKFLLELVDFL